MNSYAEDDPIVTEIKSKLRRDICDIWAWLDTIYPGALFVVGVSWHHSSGREYVARVAPVTFSTDSAPARGVGASTFGEVRV